MATGVDFGIHLHTEGADQAAAGVAKVDAAASALEKSTVRLQGAQAALAAATQRAEAAQAAHAKALADSSTSQERIAQAATRLAQAQASQAAAMINLRDSQAQLTRQTAGLGTAAGLTAQQTQQLGFQLNDLFVQIASGQSPLTALIQQGSQLSGTFGGLGNTVSALRSVFTPVRLLAGGVAAAIGSIALAAIEGDRESKALARSLEVTGNAAGLTEGRYNAMARTIASSTKTSIGSARDVLAQLAASGRLSSDAMASTARAVTLVSKATGEAADDVAKRFLSITDGVAKGAEGLNKQFNFLTVEQYRLIAALERQGDVQGAVAATMDALSSKVGDQATKLGLAERAWNALKIAISDTVEAAKSIGRDPTLEDRISRLGAAAQAATSPRGSTAQAATLPRGINSTRITESKEELAASLRLQQGFAQEELRLLNRQAEARGQIAQRAQRGIAFEKELEGSLSAQAKLAKDIVEFRKRAEGVRATGSFTPEQVQAGERAIVQRSAATAQSIEAALARVQAKGAQAAEAAKGNLAQIQFLVSTGQLSQIEGIERITQLEAQQLTAERQALEETLGIAKRRAENETDRIRLKGQIAVKDIEIANRTVQGERQVAQAIFEKRKAAELATQAQQDENRAAQAADLQRQTQERLQLAGAVYEQVRALNDSVELFRLEEQLVAADAQTRQVLIEKLKIEQRLRLDIAKINASTAFSGDEKKVLVTDLKSTATEAGIVASERVAFEFQQRAAKQIESDIENAIIQGGDAGERYLRDLFRRKVYEIFLQPIVGSFVGALTGAGGQGSAGQLAGAFNFVQAGVNLYKGFSAGFASIGTGVANAFGTTAANAMGTGLDGFLATNNAFGTAGGAGGTGTALGSFASAAAGIAGGVFAGRSISDGFSAFGGGSGNSAVNLGTAIGTAILPGLGSAIGGAIGGAVNRLFGRKAPEVESQFITGSISGAGQFSGDTETNIVAKGGLFRSDKRSQTVEAITGDLDKALDAGAKQLADLARRYGAALGLPVEQLADISSSIRVQITEDVRANEEDVAAALQQFAGDLLGGFSAQLEPLRGAGETVAQTIERVGGALLSVNQVLTEIGVAALATSVEGGKAALELAALFGGVDSLRQAAGEYYAAFFTDAEKAARSTQRITDALAGVNVEMPKSVAEFRALVEAQDRTTDAGRKTFAALIGVAGAFADLAKGSNSAEDALRQRVDLEGELLRLQGDTTELRRREREQIDETNRALYDQIQALQDTQKAAEEAAQAAQRLADRQRGIERGVDAVIGDFLSGPQLANYLAGRIDDTLAAGGIVDPTIPGILASTREDIIALWNAVGIDGREAILAAYGAWEQLQEVLYSTARAVGVYRQSTLADAIEQARLGSLAPADRLSQLRGTEATLFGRLETAEDPVAVADRLSGVIVARIALEAELREGVDRLTRETLEKQLDGLKRQRDLAQDIFQFTGSLRFSEVSPLSPRAQLEAARALFDSTLLKARQGDQNALGNLLGNARSFIDEASGAFASGPGFSAIFEQVTRTLDAFGLGASALDPEIAVLERQVTSLDGIESSLGEEGALYRALLRIDETLAARFLVLGTVGGEAVTEAASADTSVASGSTAVQAQPANLTALIGATTTQGDRTATLLQSLLEKLDTLLVVANGSAVVDQVGFQQTVRGLAAIEAPLVDIARATRLNAHENRLARV